MNKPDVLGPWVRRFLLKYLVGERHVAENTRRSYRDTLALLIPFLATAAKTSVDRLRVEDVAADGVRQFLGHLEQARACRLTTLCGRPHKMIYTHVVNQGGRGVRSPLNQLASRPVRG